MQNTTLQFFFGLGASLLAIYIDSQALKAIFAIIGVSLMGISLMIWIWRAVSYIFPSGEKVIETPEPGALPDGRWSFVGFVKSAIPNLGDEGEAHGFLLSDLVPAVAQAALDGVLIIDGKQLDTWLPAELAKGDLLVAIPQTEFAEMELVCSPHSVLDGNNLEVKLVSTRAQHRYVDLHFRDARAARKWLKDVWPSKQGIAYSEYLAAVKERAERVRNEAER